MALWKVKYVMSGGYWDAEFEGRQNHRVWKSVETVEGELFVEAEFPHEAREKAEKALEGITNRGLVHVYVEFGVEEVDTEGWYP